MKSTNAGVKHINNNLKIITSFANTLDQNIDLDAVKRSQIINLISIESRVILNDPEKLKAKL
ncbi:MAG: hypothetical protein ACTHL3_09735 [Candidatus Nitrosocosmicus sp.]